MFTSSAPPSFFLIRFFRCRGVCGRLSLLESLRRPRVGARGGALTRGVLLTTRPAARATSLVSPAVGGTTRPRAVASREVAGRRRRARASRVLRARRRQRWRVGYRFRRVVRAVGAPIVRAGVVSVRVTAVARVVDARLRVVSVADAGPGVGGRRGDGRAGTGDRRPGVLALGARRPTIPRAAVRAHIEYGPGITCGGL